MATLASSTAPAFQITIMEGPLASAFLMEGQPQGVVALSDRMLPYGPTQGGSTSWEGLQRIKRTYYAGNTRATLQVMGPTEEGTNLNGTWKDIFLGRGVAMQLVQLFDAIRRSGALLKVQWGPIVRIGMLERFKFTPERLEDVQWEMQFVWAGQDEKPAPLISSTGIQNPREGLTAVATELKTANNDVLAFLADPISRIVAFPDSILEQVDLALSNAFTLVSLMNQTAGAVSDIQELPRNVLERGVAVSVAAGNAMNKLSNAVLDINSRQYVIRDDGATLLDFFDFLFGMLGSADAANETAWETAGSLQGQLIPEIIAEIRVPPGTDLRDIAQQYYGDPDDWYPIALASGFADSTVPPNPSAQSDITSFTVRVPRRASGAVSNLRDQGC